MNKNILFLSLIFVFIIGLNASLNGFTTASYDIEVDVKGASWFEEIPDAILLKNSSSFVLDSDLSSIGNGYCKSSTSFQNTYTINKENTSEVDCEISSTKLSLLTSENFTGSALCEVSCFNSGESFNTNFSILVIDDEDPEPEVIYVSSGGGGGGGISPAQLAEILGQTQITNLAIKPESIKLILRPGESISEIIAVENKLDKIYDINIQKNTLVSYVNIKNSASLQPKSITNIPIQISISPEEENSIITGKIDFDEYTDLSIVITILDQIPMPDSQQIDLLVTLGTDYVSPTLIFTGEIDKKNILPGTLLKPKLKLSDFYDEGYTDITLTYYLHDFNNNQLLSYSENTSSQLDKTLSILLPEDIPIGNYALTFEVKYGDYIAKNTQTLQIVSKEGIITEELIILTLIIGLLAYSIYAVSRGRKKRLYSF